MGPKEERTCERGVEGSAWMNGGSCSGLPVKYTMNWQFEFLAIFILIKLETSSLNQVKVLKIFLLITLMWVRINSDDCIHDNHTSRIQRVFAGYEVISSPA